MRKMTAAAALLLLLAAFAAGAKPALSIPSLSQEVSAALADYSARDVGDLTVGDLEEIAARVAAAQRKASFVPRSAMMSLMMPGMGQFVNGDRTGGALFAAGHLAVAAGTVAAVWLLLPLDVQPQSLFVQNLSQFKPALEGHSPLDYLPAAAAAAGGMLLDGILRAASAHHAARLASENIAEGRVSFEPGIGPGGRGFMMGVKITKP